MEGWTAADLLPGLWVLLLGAGLSVALKRWYDPVPPRVLAVFGLVLAALFWKVLFGGGILLPLDNLRVYLPFTHLAPADPPSLGLQGDLVNQIAPWGLEVRRALWEGRWPLWNRWAGIGMPLMGDPQTQAFQPLVVAAYPFPFEIAAGVTAALRVLVALVFLFLLLRHQDLGEPAALAGSLAFGMGGFLLLWLGWPMGNGPALLPAVLYALVRVDDSGRTRDLILLFLATASLLLGGHPETIVYSLALCGLFLLARARRRGRDGGGRLLVRAGLAMALAGGAAAPILLPVQDYLPKTERAAVVAFQLAPLSWDEQWDEIRDLKEIALWRKNAVQRLVPVAAPRAYGDYGVYWGRGNVIEDASGFAGSAALLATAAALLSLGRRDRFPQERLIGLALLGSLLLLAQPPAVTRLLGQLPLIGPAAIHQNHRLLLIVCLCTAWLAACELERRVRGQGSRWTVLAAALVLAGLVAWGYLAHPHPTAPEILAAPRSRLLAIHLGTLAGAAALLALRLQGKAARALPWMFCGLVFAELFAVHAPALPPAPRRLAYPVTPPVAFLQKNLGNDRFVGLGQSVFHPNHPLVYGLTDLRIDNPSLPADYARLSWPLRQKTRRLFARPGHPLYDFLGVRYVMTRPGVKLPFRLVFRHPDAWIWERPRPLPRLFLPVRATIFRGGSWQQWLEENRDFSRQALVEESAAQRRKWRARQPRASGLDLSFPEPARVSARAHLAEPRLLASSIYQDGHWRVLVDGERQPTVLANGPLVAGWISPGERRVDLLYRPGVFVLGCVLAALTLAAAAVWWVPRPASRLSSGA
jgi:hypothetical protein